MKDKTYYVVIDGKTVRVRAPKKPDKETMKALEAMISKVKILGEGDLGDIFHPKQ